MNKTAKIELRDRLLEMQYSPLALQEILEDYYVDVKEDKKNKTTLGLELADLLARVYLHPDWYSPILELNRILKPYVVRRRPK